MKTKLTKIWGVGLVVGLLVMLIGAAIPVSAATLAWSTVGTPNPITNQLQDDTDVNALAIAPDGVTMFAYDNTDHKLYKSANAGQTWTSTGIGTGLEDDVDGSLTEDTGDDVVALAVSPDYATDSTVVGAINDKVFRSINGGKSFGEVGTNVGGLIAAITPGITSLDVSPHYLGGTAILVGDSNAAQGGGVTLFTTSSLAWTDMAVGSYDAMAVAFSPNHKTDAQYLAVVNGAADTLIRTRFGTDAWAAGILDSTISTTNEPTSAVIAFADDYEWSSNNRVFVGTEGGAKDDVYRVHGALPGGASLNYDLNVGGTGTETEVYSVAVNGNVAEADVLVGQKAANSVKRCHDPTTSTITWRGSTKSPTGAANVIVAWSPTGDDAYAVSTGDGSAYSRSTDGGVTWNQLGLMDVSAVSTNLSIVASAVVDANTMYIIMADSGDTENLFKTTDGGSSWERIWYQADMASLALSPNYATDETLFVAVTGSTRIWKTTNAGETFIGLTSPANVTAIGVVDKDTYYTGHSAAVYKSGRWVAATGVSDVVLSFAIADDGTIFIGTDDGDVQQSTDDAGKFTTLGAGNQLSDNNVVVALDPDYASNNYIYAGCEGDATTTSAGVYRWEYGSSTVWKELDSGAAADELRCTAVALSADGTLYASSNLAAKGVRRSVAPQGPSAAAWAFESVLQDIPDSTAITLDSLSVTSGSNVLYAIANNITVGSYGYAYRLIAFTDNLAVTPELSGPKDGTATPGTSVTFSWKKIDSPVSLTTTYEVSSDSTFAVSTATGTVPKTGTGVTVTGLTPGTKYWWRVYVSSPLRSKNSASWTFTPKLTATGTTSYTTAPAPGAIDVSLRPVFQWASVPGATSYELELADNPFFANASVKKPLTHTVWTWDTDLEYSTTYYWRARALKSGKGILTNYSSWSEASFTTMAKPAPPAPPAAPPQITVQPAPPAPPAVVQIPPAPPSPVTPAVIWAIIIIGAVLVIAVIVLIVRTRRVP